MRRGTSIIALAALCACGKATAPAGGSTSSTGAPGTTGPSFTRLSTGTSASSGSGAASSASSGTSGAATGGAAGASGSTGIVDLDQDGLDDGYELQVARAYLPFISLDPSDGCAAPDGMVVRVRPHPLDTSRPPRYLEIRYDHLYQTDCGASGHDGDDENIAITVDTSLPAPEGIQVIAAISHRNTACEHDSWCVQRSWSASPCSGYAACDHPASGSNRDGYPVVYVSKDKHGDYATTNGCTFGCDFGACTLSAVADVPAIVDVGEPGHPLVSDLTAQGFINLDAGWTDTALYHYDPWGTQPFGGAGTVSADLTDSALDTPICQ